MGLKRSIVPRISLAGGIAGFCTGMTMIWYTDAYDYAGNGRFIGTYMGGPEYNFAGSPGEVVTFKPDGKGGYTISGDVPAGVPGAREQGNPGGIPEPCSQDEAASLCS